MVFCHCASTIFVTTVAGVGEEGADWFDGGRERQYTTTTAIGAGVGWWHVASAGRVDGVRGECDNGWIGLVV